MATSTNPSNQGVKLKLKIPGQVWNAYEPQTQEPASRATRSATRLNPTASSEAVQERDSEPPPTTSVATRSSLRVSPEARRERDNEVPPTPDASSRAQPKNCKVKLHGFHYGGPKRVTKGAFRNEIAHEAPCLRPTCTNCRTYHRHLMYPQALPEDHAEPQAQNVFRLTGPPVDPRLLDGTWRNYPSSTENMNMQMSDAHMSPWLDSSPYLDPPDRSYQIYLPTSMVVQTISGAPARTQWRSEPRNRQPVRLAFVSQDGVRRFGELTKLKENRERRREYDRKRRAKV